MPGPTRALYLTFDDGPDPLGTPRVLELLARRGVPATFFVIAEKSEGNPGLFREIHSAGHAIGNHSLDHAYGNFFRGKKALSCWIQGAEERLTQLLGGPTVGFRPPNGIQTPELRTALRELGLPLVLWRIRFFDTLLQWTPERARQSLGRARAGDIILLHDRQRADRLETFLSALDAYITGAQALGYEFKALSRNACLTQQDPASQSS